MVCEWGMSDELGPLTYGKKEEQIFLGREIAQHRDFSEETARQIDIAVKQIIVDASQKVMGLLDSNRDILNKMAEELLEKETIVLEDIERITHELRPDQYPEKQPAAPRPGRSRLPLRWMNQRSSPTPMTPHGRKICPSKAGRLRKADGCQTFMQDHGHLECDPRLVFRRGSLSRL